MSNNKINLALLFGGRSAEHEVSILSARSIYQALNKDKYKIFPIAITKKGYFLSLKKSKKILLSNTKVAAEIKREKILTDAILDILTQKIDLLFPILHGPYGEDGKIQGFLDTLEIKYIGCDLSSSAVSMDKALMKKIFSYHNIPQSDFVVLKKEDLKNKNLQEIFNKLSQKLKLPLFIKPANMGSSIGINRVKDKSSFKAALNEAFIYDHKIVIESSVEAREIESAVVEIENKIKVSAAGEITASHDFYDYQAKYEDQNTTLTIPAELSKKSRKKIKELSIKAFKIVGGKGISRLDFFVNEENEQILVNEINTMPGFTKYSMYPLLFAEVGIPYSQLLDNLVQQALNKDY